MAVAALLQASLALGTGPMGSAGLWLVVACVAAMPDQPCDHRYDHYYMPLHIHAPGGQHIIRSKLKQRAGLPL